MALFMQLGGELSPHTGTNEVVVGHVAEVAATRRTVIKAKTPAFTPTDRTMLNKIKMSVEIPRIKENKTRQ